MKIDIDQRYSLSKSTWGFVISLLLFPMLGVLFSGKELIKYVFYQSLIFAASIFIISKLLYFLTNRAFIYYSFLTASTFIVFANLLTTAFHITNNYLLVGIVVVTMIIVIVYFFIRDRKKAELSREINEKLGKIDINKGYIDIRGYYQHNIYAKGKPVACVSSITKTSFMILIPAIGYYILDNYGIVYLSFAILIFVASSLARLGAMFIAITTDVRIIEIDFNKQFVLETNKKYKPINYKSKQSANPRST